MADATIDGFTSDIQALRRELRLLQSDLSRLSGGMGGGNNVMANSLGQVPTNLFQNQVTEYQSLSGLGAAGTGFLSRLGGKLPPAAGNLLSGALTVGGGVLGLLAGGMSMMPSMEKYLVRETGYYQAGLASMGTLSRNALQQTTRAGLGAGMTSVGSDATVAAILSGRGVNIGSSLYRNIVSQVGNAGLYFNQANEVAAASMEALTSGASSASLLQRGIFTSNPMTGETLNEVQIFEQLARRWNVTGDMTVAEIQEEMRTGFLGANINSLDMDNATKERLRNYLLTKGRDSGFAGVDFSSQESMNNWAKNAFGAGSALQKAGYENPMAPAYQMAGSETDLIEAFSSEYGKGFKTAADIIGDLQDVVGDTATAFGQLNAVLSTFLGSDVGSGFAAGGAFFLGGALTLDALKNLFSGGEDAAGGGAGLGDISLGDMLAAPADGPISAGYGKEGPQFIDGTHNGIDYAVPIGTIVRAAYDGEVDKVEHNKASRSYGLYIVLDHKNGWTTTYAHLSKAYVKKGDFVKKGQPIGESGNTGTTDPHLHFEVKRGNKDVPPSQFNPTSRRGGGAGATDLGMLWGGATSSGSYGTGSTVMPGVIGGETMGAGSTISGSTSVSSSGSPQVTINLSIASASEEEARRFAQIVKDQLEEDTFVNRMGAR